MTPLCFIDTETTGLDPRIHEAYEVCWWLEGEDSPTTLLLPSTLNYADLGALRIGGYFERVLPLLPLEIDRDGLADMTRSLVGVTLVGSNPSFDAAMLTRVIGAPVWHHRMIDVSNAGMWVFGWERPKGLADVADGCRNRGYEIPEPNHTAEGDVRTTRAAYYALREIGGKS